MGRPMKDATAAVLKCLQASHDTRFTPEELSKATKVDARGVADGLAWLYECGRISREDLPRKTGPGKYAYFVKTPRVAAPFRPYVPESAPIRLGGMDFAAIPSAIAPATQEVPRAIVVMQARQTGKTAAAKRLAAPADRPAASRPADKDLEARTQRRAGVRDAIRKALSAGPASIPQLRAALPAFPAKQIADNMYVLRHEGEATRCDDGRYRRWPTPAPMITMKVAPQIAPQQTAPGNAAPIPPVRSATKPVGILSKVDSTTTTASPSRRERPARLSEQSPPRPRRETEVAQLLWLIACLMDADQALAAIAQTRRAS